MQHFCDNLSTPGCKKIRRNIFGNCLYCACRTSSQITSEGVREFVCKTCKINEGIFTYKCDNCKCWNKGSRKPTLHPVTDIPICWKCYLYFKEYRKNRPSEILKLIMKKPATMPPVQNKLPSTPPEHVCEKCSHCTAIICSHCYPYNSYSHPKTTKLVCRNCHLYFHHYKTDRPVKLEMKRKSRKNKKHNFEEKQPNQSIQSTSHHYNPVVTENTKNYIQFDTVFENLDTFHPFDSNINPRNDYWDQQYHQASPSSLQPTFFIGGYSQDYYQNGYSHQMPTTFEDYYSYPQNVPVYDSRNPNHFYGY
ncbi:GATA-type domain-containing protein [Caenorhabditis elegans]|uniref:GATA-type domain-containing protein n=1 Tax=Caenorhabditis elegans TaxID=6239 RepID=Q18369_CAEEL|nr:GATA-type domain-containing protein [Caenorhabditis elegans]CAA90027.2 GATA-type domain-containing protein [Caenorhabditis elegans]|eukprot:NP_509756.2 Uncharacterized protein CELE_C33D3.3 [Caenorhabditis elegans]